MMLWVNIIWELVFNWDSMVSNILCFSDCVLLMMMNELCNEWFWMWVSGSILSMLWDSIFLSIVGLVSFLRVLKIVCVYGFIFLFLLLGR